MKNNNERINQALNSVDKYLQNIDTNKDWIDYLRFQSKFYNYSAQNTILIMSQFPEASYVAGYTKWQKLNRYVKKGEKGIQILAPIIKKKEYIKEPSNPNEYHHSEAEIETKSVLVGYRIVHVYDLLQTEGSDEFIPTLVSGLKELNSDNKKLYQQLLNIFSKEFSINEVSDTSAKGSYNLISKEIAIRSDLSSTQKIKTLIHEIVHAYDFKMHPDENISRSKREIIAESTAYIIALNIGIDTASYSIPYLKSWLKTKDDIKNVADTVQKLSNIIITKIAGSLDSAFLDLKEDE